MGTRTNLRPQVVLSASMAASLISAPTIMQSLSQVSYALSWTGTSPVGTVSVQVSNDYALGPNGTVSNSGTWNTITLNQAGVFVTTIAISGNTGSGFIDVNDTAAYAIRLIYTRASGTGTLTAVISGKVA